MYQPFAYYKTEVATLAPPAPPSGITLPSGAIVVYDFTTASSWPGSGRFVYDLSGNGFTGSFTGSISSGSAGAVSFNEPLAMIGVGNGNTTFYSAFNQRKAMYIGIQYQTGSWSANTTLASTWGTRSDNTQDIGYVYFINGGAPASNQRTGIQLYNAGGNAGAAGYYLEPATPGWATGSLSNTAGLLININSGSYRVFNNNTQIGQVTGITTSKVIAYGQGSGTGIGMRLGNRYGENFRGKFSKFVAYNRPLSDAELATIQAWMTGSAAAPVESTLKLWLDSGNPQSYPGTGTTWFDLSGNNNHVTQSGTIGFDSGSNSFIFNNNAANYFSSSTATNLAVSASGELSDMSMEMWLQLSTGAESTGNRYYCGFLVGNWSNSGTAAISFTDNGFGNGLNAQMGGNADANTWIPTPAQTDNYTKTNSKGVWRQVVFTRSGSVGTFYVDGLQDRQNSNYAGATVTTSNQLYIGKLNYGEPFFGNISIAKYWVGKTLSAAEVSASFQATKNRFGR